MNKKKIIFDSILNIAASAIPIIILQLIILPILGSEVGGSEYGLILTLVSLSTLFSLPFGNVLNNIRLLVDAEYSDKKIAGDFNILLLISVILNSLMIIIGTIIYEDTVNILNIILIAVFSNLNLIREYLVVSFRIKLSYDKILINNLILGIGYLLGLAVFYKTGKWQYIYIVGAGCSTYYIFKNSELIMEPFKRTILFKITSYKTIVLFCSNFLKTLMMYADKLIIFPLMGATAVTVYYSATVMGKIISMAITPISGVVLSHLAKSKGIKLKTFLHLIGVVSMVGIMGYIIIILISEPILKLLYPDWANESMKLIYITTGTAIIEVLISVIHPIILKFKHINWQLFINVINLIIYMVCTIGLFYWKGLIGFCIGILIASVIKLIFMIFIFVYGSRQVKN